MDERGVLKGRVSLPCAGDEEEDVELVIEVSLLMTSERVPFPLRETFSLIGVFTVSALRSFWRASSVKPFFVMILPSMDFSMSPTLSPDFSSSVSLVTVVTLYDVPETASVRGEVGVLTARATLGTAMQSRSERMKNLMVGMGRGEGSAEVRKLKVRK